MANQLHQTEFRTFSIGQELRQRIKQCRQSRGQTVREFVRLALETELTGLVEVLRRELPNLDAVEARPVRLPLTAELLGLLQRASTAVNLPANRLLLTCLAHSAARKRQRKQSK